MPGPRKKKQNTHNRKASASTPKSPASDETPLGSLFRDIEISEGWGSELAYLCDYFELPDINTRSGLKRVHARFENISQKLDYAFSEAKKVGNAKVMEGICGIWTKMCHDALLRNKLFMQGLLPRLIFLLDNRATRYTSLRSLRILTHHGGEQICAEIAKETPIFVRLMEEFPNDPEVNEELISIIAHTTGVVINNETIPIRFKKLIDMPTLLKLICNAMCRPDTRYLSPSHALSFFMSASFHYAREMKTFPPVMNLLVACLRSKDLSLRCNVFVTLLRINMVDAEEDNRNLDPQKLMASIERGFPDHLAEFAFNYGMKNTEVYSTLYCMRDFQQAMMECARDHNLLKLGRTIADLILQTEYSVADGGFQAMNERTGKMEIMDLGLPFKMWSDSLPHCGKALRQNGELDKADIVEIKHWIMKQKIGQAIEIAKTGIKRNPNVAYFYYAIGLGADSREALRAVKKGLKAKQTSPFVSTYLLWRGVDSAGQLGVTTLANTPAGDQRWSEGVAFLMSAYDDAKKFINEAPPDAKRMQTMLNWYIILHIAIHGPELSVELREIEPTMKKLDLSRQFLEFMNIPNKKTQLRLTREMIMHLYTPAVKNNTFFIEKLDTLHITTEKSQEKSTEKAEDTLAAWIEGLQIDDAENGELGQYHHHCRTYKVAMINKADLELYRCSHCENPSAVLKKCGGCGKSRYCDSSCQKLHWPEHKKLCKA
ncbi:hypothetical protein QCA50_013310 [Cerrena zonata]|uniref:MYND-type domain-containing protein n=1 Tax=Cerrena zonata TaxID=2478898 RepID=A0AAW0G1G4_9APHY